MAAAWHIAGREQGHLPAFISIVVVPVSLLAAARGLRPGDELAYRGRRRFSTRRHSVRRTRQSPRRNGSRSFRSGGENSRTLEEGDGPIEAFPSFHFLRGCPEKVVHNLATEIPTILFPPPKHPSIGELSEGMRGLTL
jgi:hypothetical protein